MTKNDITVDPLQGGGVHIARSRGAVSGFLLSLLGAWGAPIALIRPSFGFGLSTDESRHWTAARFWLEVLPGVATIVGGVLLLGAANRISTQPDEHQQAPPSYPQPPNYQQGP